jgi:hypothetical protein
MNKKFKKELVKDLRKIFSFIFTNLSALTFTFGLMCLFTLNLPLFEFFMFFTIIFFITGLILQ